MVPEMIGLGVLAELDTVQLPNIIHLDDKFKNPAFDPGNKYSIPYLWGTTGVGWNSAKVTDPIKSCADVLEPEKVRRWEEGGAKTGTMFEEMREPIGAGLKYLGYSLNHTDDAHLSRGGSVIARG